MKFRLKGDAFKTARVVEFDGTNVLVSELKCRVCEILRLQEEDMRYDTSGSRPCLEFQLLISAFLLGISY